MRYIFSALLLALSLISFEAESQSTPYFFRNINRADGLSQSEAKAIIQDSYGFMWFGTRNRLNRYDGKSMKVIDCIDRESKFSNNNITSLFEDKKRQLWIGTDEGVFVLNPATEEIRHISIRTTNGTSIDDWISGITGDSRGNIWIISPNQGVFRYYGGKLWLYRVANITPYGGNPESICIDKSGKLWVGTNGSGLYTYNYDTNRFVAVAIRPGEESLSGQSIYCMCDYGDYLILGCHEGKLLKFNKRSCQLTAFNAPQVHYKIIRDVRCYDGNIWVGTDSGLFVIDEDNGKVSQVTHDPMCNFTLSDNQICKIYRDREKGIWIGTNRGGVNYLPPSYSDFTRYVPLTSNSINSKRVRSIIEGENESIWVGTEDNGVCYLDTKTGFFQNLTPYLSGKKTLSLLSQDMYTWIGYFKNGIDILNNHTKKVRHYSGEMLGLNESSIYAICDDSNGNTWIGNGWGVYKGNKWTMKFTHMKQFGDCYIFDIIEDINRNIWVATMGNGVFCYTPATGKMRHYTHKLSDPNSIGSNSVNNITETSDGSIWISTDRGGISVYNKRTDNFTNYSLAQGLPDDTAYKILEDNDGNLWFGTNNGLVKFNRAKKTCKVFTTYNGLPSNQFTYKSALKSSDGRFYFGCSEGMVSFNPYSLSENSIQPSVYITKLLVNNKEITPFTDNSPLKQSINHTQSVTLSHTQNTIGFEFAALSYIMPTANQIAYKMDGVNKDWVYTSQNFSMMYANLSPGTYTLHVKGSNNDGVWSANETTLQIKISEPWWFNGFAKAFYIIAITFMIYLAVKYLKIRNDKKSNESKILYESEKEKELYRTKLDFYTGVAHEIRTPVTLISGPLETLLDMDIADPEIKKNLSTMQRNTNELLNITNQLLDFRKIDAVKMRMNFSCINISELLKEKILEFEALAEQSKDMECSIPDYPVFVSGDRNSILKIINNLLSNAVKYSDNHIFISLTTENDDVYIRTENDGEVVPEDSKDKIFDPFFQLKKTLNRPSSSGLGLNIARSFAEMNNGSLSYSVENGLNVFLLKLKMETNIPDEEQHQDTIFDNEATGSDDDEKRNLVILLVEDNEELLNFIADKMSALFTIRTAHNGVEAIQQLQSCAVDMVITDIMMPEMDGIELCKQIKANVETSHIPVVLLTAKNDLDSKVKGLKIGADAYIEKPFSFKYLVAQINSIIDNRIREREAFSKKPFMSTQNFGISKADQAIIDKIIETIEDNFTNHNFGVEMLADKVCMSRSSLHRKIKAVTGNSPTDFIRLIRLKKSCELISEGSYRIGEVCYLVGINSPSYFIKLFQKQFGMSPKEFEKQQRKKTDNQDNDNSNE